jgi:DNA polymerase-4
MPVRQIIHLDLDAFFASVEELLNPELRGRPIVVGGSAQGRGVVSSASYAARRFGISSAMPTAQALRLCPDVVVVRPRHGVYGGYSKRVMMLLEDYAPLVEQLSIDEAFFDVTSSCLLWGSAHRLALELQERIEREVNLSASLGIATSKLVSKSASAIAKPHGIVDVPSGEEAAFLAPLPIERMWGVGPATAKPLHELGVRTIGELASLPPGFLEARFGEHGRSLARHSRGLDDRAVHSEGRRKSISKESTFSEDVGDRRQVERRLLLLSEGVARQLRRRGLFAHVVKLKLRYSDFTTVTRQSALAQPTNLEKTLYEEGRELLAGVWIRGRRIRLVGIGAGKLSTTGYQLELFNQQDDQRLARLAATVDRIRDRFGEGAIRRASLLE